MKHDPAELDKFARLPDLLVSALFVACVLAWCLA